MLLLLTHMAWADPPILGEVPEPTLLLADGSGTWPRVVPHGDSWRLLMANGGDLYWRDLNKDLTADNSDRHNMTNHGSLTDHAIAQCDDGGFIDATSSYTSDWDDTLTIFRWDADFNLINQYIIDENSTTHSYADAAIICKDEFTAVGGFMERSIDVATAPLHRLDPNTAEQIGTETLYISVTWFGAAWAWEGDYATSIRASTNGNTMIIDRLDPTTWRGHGAIIVPLDKTDDVHWFVRTLQWGEYWFVPYIQLDTEVDWHQGSGDLYLAMFDADWSLLSSTRITDYGGGTGATQPWISTDGEQLVLSWNHNVAPYGVLSPLTAPEEPEDTGKDTAPPGDTSEPEDTGVTIAPLEETEPTCGCGAGSIGGLWASLLALGALTRRRSTPAATDAAPPEAAPHGQAC